MPAVETGPRRILDALVRVLVRDGLTGVSVRRVATEAGVSIGAVQHHFATRDALLAGAMDHVSAGFAQALAAEREASDDPRETLRRVSVLLAGVDDDTGPAVVWLWFAAQATTGGLVAEQHAREWGEVEDGLRTLLAHAHPSVDAELEAATLLALVDGLATARAAEPGRMPADRARRVVEAHLRRLP